ncbi:MAG: glucokinase [Parvibaculum sp.]
MVHDHNRVLVADIGGTHARFAYAEAGNDAEARGPKIGAPFIVETHSFESFADALQEFRDETGAPDLAAAAVCGAGPLQGKPGSRTIEMTNCPWHLSEDVLRDRLGIAKVGVVNDFAAIAFSVPQLTEDEVRMLGPGTADPAGPIAVIGAGTGLGVAGLMPDGKGHYLLIDGEGGHADLSPVTSRELAVFEVLLRRFGSVEAETILSGPGLEALHDALCELENISCETVHAAEIAARAATGGERVSHEAVSLFTGWLGAAAANVALTMGATGGVYVAGGIVPKWGGLFNAKAFRTRFETRGKMGKYLEPIPTYLVTTPDPAFKGLVEIARSLRTF